MQRRVDWSISERIHARSGTRQRPLVTTMLVTTMLVPMSMKKRLPIQTSAESLGPVESSLRTDHPPGSDSTPRRPVLTSIAPTGESAPPSPTEIRLRAMTSSPVPTRRSAPAPPQKPVTRDDSKRPLSNESEGEGTVKGSKVTVKPSAVSAVSTAMSRELSVSSMSSNSSGGQQERASGASCVPPPNRAKKPSRRTPSPGLVSPSGPGPSSSPTAPNENEQSPSAGFATPPRLPLRTRAQTVTASVSAAPPLPIRIGSPSSSTSGSVAFSARPAHARSLPPPLPPEASSPRSSVPTSRVMPRPTAASMGNASSEDEEDPARTVSLAKRAMDELPDSTRANKRAPTFVPDIHLRHPHHINSFAVFGRFVCTGSHQVRVYDSQMSERPIFVVDLRETGLEFRIKDPKVTAMCFRPTSERMDEGRYLLCGTKDGHIWNLDIMTGEVTDSKSWTHGATITHILRYKHWMLSLDEMGKLHTYSTEGDPSKIPQQIRTSRISEKFTFACLLRDQLWTATAPSVRSTTNASSPGPTVRVHVPFTDDSIQQVGSTSEWTGAVLSSAILPFQPSKVYLGHEGGFISIWDLETRQCLEVLKVSSTDILGLEGVGGRLWIGNRKGQINVCDVSEQPWQITNVWTAQ